MMMTEPQRTQLHAFFELLERRDLVECNHFMRNLERLCAADPAYRDWHDYCAAILVHEDSKDFADALHRYTTLLARPTIDRYLAGQILISLAAVKMQLSDFAGARLAAQEAVVTFGALGEVLEQAKASAQYALTYHLAYSHGAIGNHMLQAGIDACQRALELLRPLPVNLQTGFVWVQAWNTLGAFHNLLHNWSEALDCFEQLLAIADQTRNSYVLALAKSNLAHIRRRLGSDPHLIQSELRAALEIYGQLNRDYEAWLTLADLAHLYSAMSCPAEALACFAQAIARVEGVRAGISDRVVRTGFTAHVADLFANAVLCAWRANDLPLAFSYMEQGRSRAFLDRLSNSPTDSSIRATEAVLSLAQVQATLPEDAILLEYFTTGVIDDPERHTPSLLVGERPTLPPAITLLFAITTHEITVYELKLSPNDLNPLDFDSTVEDRFLRPTMRRLLAQHLLPIAVEQQSLHKRRLFIIPHGPLHYVPFQALWTTSEVGQLPMIFSPSATILMRSRALSPKWLPLHTSIEGSSGLDRGVSPATLTIGCNDNQFVQLTYAEAEAGRIAQLTQGLALLGPQAKRHTLLHLASRVRFLHFSCHGTFHADDPLQSSLHIGLDEILTAQEVMAHLTLADCVVSLSACASGLSRVRRGDELFGLVRAFLFAGASALIVSQWRVDERSTYLLMSKFYELVMQGEDLAAALQQAQQYLQGLTVHALLELIVQNREIALASDAAFRSILQMLPESDKPYAEPYYWAAFILIYG